MTSSDDHNSTTARAAGARPADAPLPPGKLKQRVIPDPPEIDQAKGRQTLAFLAVLVLAACVIMAAVGALNTLADPYGMVGMKLVPSATTSDRTIKADAIDALDQAPELVVLGSSRSMRYEPEYLKEKTGLRTFNAGVNGIGGTADAWAMTNYIHDSFPGARQAYFWLLDVESFVPFRVQGRTTAEPRLGQYVGGDAPVGRKTPARSVRSVRRAVVENRATIFSWVTARDSIRVLLNQDKATTKEAQYRDRFLPDGGLTERAPSAASWAIRFPKSVKRYSNLYRNVYKKPDPEAQQSFERTLRFMNDSGVTPVIVLTPINPKLLQVIGPLGWPKRHQQVVDYVESLHDKYDFVFVDNTDPAMFGADPAQWYDGVHMTTANTRRAIDYVLRQTGGIPR